MGAVELAGAVTDPDHVRRAVVPVAGERVLPGQALLVGQDQRLVARPEVDLVQALLGAEVDAAGRHEAQGAVDLRRDALVAPPLGRRRDELLVPQVHLGEVGEAALGEGAQQVERRGRLVVGGHQPFGVRRPGVGLEGLVVDHVPAEGRQLDVADSLGVRRPWLGELAGDAADLHHRHAGGVGERHGHLQDDLELVPDRVRARSRRTTPRSRRPGAGTRSRRPPGRAARQMTGLTGEDERAAASARRASAFLSASASGHSGCCAAGNLRQDAALQGEVSGWLVTATG